MLHPQFWPEGIDFGGKRVVVVGSGATAITLVPELAKLATHVTMAQRSPTYIAMWPRLFSWPLSVCFGAVHLLFGLLFLGIGDTSRSDYNITSHFGALVMIGVSGMMGAAQVSHPALRLFSGSRH